MDPGGSINNTYLYTFVSRRLRLGGRRGRRGFGLNGRGLVAVAGADLDLARFDFLAFVEGDGQKATIEFGGSHCAGECDNGAGRCSAAGSAG